MVATKREWAKRRWRLILLVAVACAVGGCLAAGSASALTRATLPAHQDVTVKGCERSDRNVGCPWGAFASALEKAIDERFVAK